MSSDELSEMRALAHPTRVAIVSLLRQHAAMTATQCANTLGLSAKTCSYHLQTLAAAGLVRELAAGGRNRPWTLAQGGPGGVPTQSGPGGVPAQVGPGGVPASHAAKTGPSDPALAARSAPQAARVRRDESVLGHAVDAVTRAADDPVWSMAATVYTRVATMNADEVRAWGEDVERLTRRHVRRAAQLTEVGEDAGRSPVRLMFYGFPTASS